MRCSRLNPLTGGSYGSDSPLNLGDARFEWDTADANAHILKLGLPAGSGTDSPTFLIGLSSAIMDVDLGIFNGATEAGIALIDSGATKAIELRWNGSLFSLSTPLGGAQITSSVVWTQGTTFTMGASQNFQMYHGSGSGFLNNDGTGLRIWTSNNVVRIGSTGTPSRIVSPTDGDFYVDGLAEINSTLYVSGRLEVISNAIWVGIGKSIGLQFQGTAATRAGIIYDTDEGMSLVAGSLSGHGNHVINIISGDNVLKDHDNDSKFTHPALCWFSETDPDTDNQQKMAAFHDTNQFVMHNYTGGFAFDEEDSNNARTYIKSVATELTSVSGATVTASSLIPDGAFVLGVTTRITTGLGTSNGTTGFNVGDGSDADRFGVASAVTSGTTTDNTSATADFSGGFTSANDVVLTAVGGNFDGTGAVRVVVHYIDVSAPTS